MCGDIYSFKELLTKIRTHNLPSLCASLIGQNMTKSTFPKAEGAFLHWTGTNGTKMLDSSFTNYRCLNFLTSIPVSDGRMFLTVIICLGTIYFYLNLHLYLNPALVLSFINRAITIL